MMSFSRFASIAGIVGGMFVAASGSGVRAQAAGYYDALAELYLCQQQQGDCSALQERVDALAATPDDFPADADHDKTDVQASLNSQGLYLKTDGSVAPLIASELPAFEPAPQVGLDVDLSQKPKPKSIAPFVFDPRRGSAE